MHGAHRILVMFLREPFGPFLKSFQGFYLNLVPRCLDDGVENGKRRRFVSYRVCGLVCGPTFYPCTLKHVLSNIFVFHYFRELPFDHTVKPLLCYLFSESRTFWAFELCVRLAVLSRVARCGSHVLFCDTGSIRPVLVPLCLESDAAV